MDSVTDIVELLDQTPRTYDEVWGATLHFAQQGIVDEVGFWLGLYRIKRDSSWAEAGYQDLDEWLGDLALKTRFEGYVARATFFEKTHIIEDLVSKGISDKMIVHALTQPTATKLLLKNEDRLPEGKTVQSTLEETEDLSPGQSAAFMGDILKLKKQWIGDVQYDMKKQMLVIPICEQDENLEVDTRVYPLHQIPYEDAEFLARKLNKSMEAI